MKAARFHRPGEPLRIEQVPDPVLQPGAVIVRVLSAFVPPYFAEMVDGTVEYPLPPLPFTPGMDTIGEVLKIADDVSGLEIGQCVFCDHFYTTVNVGGAAESCYLGAFGKGPGSERILARWRDGGFAEQLMLPAECITLLGEASSVEPAKLVRLGWLGTCYGAFLHSAFRPGQTVVVNAATGLVGSAGVLLALAMGAGRVIALGRKQAVLDELVGLDPRRISAIRIEGTEADRQTLAGVAGSADIMLDAVGDIADPTSTNNALDCLRAYGSALLVGGCMGDLSINYKWMLDRQITIIGSSWYPRSGNAELIGLIAHGALRIEALRARTFSLDEASAAVNWAASGPGGLEHAALVP